MIAADVKAYVDGEVRRALLDYAMSQRQQETVPRTAPWSGAGDVCGSREDWDVTFDGAHATFKRCVIHNGPVTKQVDDITYTVQASSGEVYLAAKWNSNTGAATIIEGATLASVTDSKAPTDEYMKFPLYVVSVAAGSVRVVEDKRKCPVIVAYV